jgi:PAS domain S-box-containing protein
LDSTGEGIFYTEGQTVRYANKTFCQMMGYTSAELIGKDAFFLSDTTALGDDERQRAIDAQEQLKRGEYIQTERELTRKDGTAFIAHLTISLANSVDGVPYTVTLARDISKDKELEAQKARFIANASHELRSPVATLNTRLYVLRQKPEQTAEQLDLLERTVDQMNRLIEDLLDVSRFESGKIILRQRDVILQTLVKDVVEIHQIHADMKSISLKMTLTDTPLSVYVDPDRITQVLTNLVVNALNYTPENGSVTVEVCADKDANNKPLAGISISDTGSGIAQDDLENIFQPFFRVADKVQGTGLGLSIVREIIVAHHGEIDVKSELGKGSTFYVRLPATPPKDEFDGNK